MKALLVAAVLACLVSVGAAQNSASSLPVQKALKETIIDEVKLNEAGLEMWVAFLRSKVQTGPDAPLNIIVPPQVLEKVGDQVVTLDLKKVPAEAVLQYCTKLMNIAYKIDSRAVVLIP